LNSNVYGLTAIFNPFNFHSRNTLFPKFEKHMRESGVHLFTVEAAFGDQQFQFTQADNPMHLQVRTDQVFFHKERMLNLGFKQLKHVQPDCRNVGWFDADVTFLDPDWAAKAAHALRMYRVIQPFGEAINLNAGDEYQWNCPSSMRAYLDKRGYHQRPPLPVIQTFKGHPGLAWMMRRETLDAMGGLYDRCVSSADTIMSNAWKGDVFAFVPCMPSEGMRRYMLDWQRKSDAAVQGHVGFIHGALAHHWHGNPNQRGYEKRWSIAAFHEFDPAVDLVDDASNGMLRWAGNKPQLEQDIKMSLSHRNEDART
jgi:hypothetical protein